MMTVYAFSPPFSSRAARTQDRKSTRLNSSHQIISYAVFCLKTHRRDAPLHAAPPERRPPHHDGEYAEATMDYARAVAEGRLQDSRLFFFHRQAFFFNDPPTPKIIPLPLLEAFRI